MTDKEIVSRSPEVLNGHLVFAGTRVPVKNFVDYLAAGDSLEDFLDSFPGVSRDQALGYLQMSADLAELESNARQREDNLHRAGEAGQRIITVAEENLARLLVGRKVEISVREPEDFESSDGAGLLKGVTTAYETVTIQSREAFELTVPPFTGMDGAQVEKLRATSLYAETAQLVLPMAVGQPVYVRLHGSGVQDAGLVGRMQVIFEVETITTEKGWRVREKYLR